MAAAVLLGVALLAAGRVYRPELLAWVEQDRVTRLRIIMAVLALATAGPLIGVGTFLWRLGGRVSRERRYPPDGLRLLQDTMILEGDAAGVRGRTFKGLGIVVTSAGAIFVVLLWRLVMLFEAIGAGARP